MEHQTLRTGWSRVTTQNVLQESQYRADEWKNILACNTFSATTSTLFACLLLLCPVADVATSKSTTHVAGNRLVWLWTEAGVNSNLPYIFRLEVLLRNVWKQKSTVSFFASTIRLHHQILSQHPLTHGTLHSCRYLVYKGAFGLDIVSKHDSLLCLCVEGPNSLHYALSFVCSWNLL